MLLFLMICIGIFLAFDLPSYTARQNLPSACYLIMSYWLSSASVIYLLEGLFKDPSKGQVFIISCNVLFGLLTLVVTLILQMLWWIPVSLVNDKNFLNASIYHLSSTGSHKALWDTLDRFSHFTTLCFGRRNFGTHDKPSTKWHPVRIWHWFIRKPNELAHFRPQYHSLALHSSCLLLIETFDGVQILQKLFSWQWIPLWGKTWRGFRCQRWKSPDQRGQKWYFVHWKFEQKVSKDVWKKSFGS